MTLKPRPSGSSGVCSTLMLNPKNVGKASSKAGRNCRNSEITRTTSTYMAPLRLILGTISLLCECCNISDASV